MLNKNIFYSKKIQSIAISSLIAVLFLSCQNNNIKQITAFTHPPGAPEVVKEKLEFTRSDSGLIRLKLNCAILKVYNDENDPHQEFPEGFKIQQFDRNHKITSSIEASYGKYYSKKELWEARQNVIAVTEKGDTLLTELLYFDEKKNLLYSDQFVKIIQKDQILTGVGFESDRQMIKWKIIKPRGSVLIEVQE